MHIYSFNDLKSTLKVSSHFICRYVTFSAKIWREVNLNTNTVMQEMKPDLLRLINVN